MEPTCTCTPSSFLSDTDTFGAVSVVAPRRLNARVECPVDLDSTHRQKTSLEERFKVKDVRKDFSTWRSVVCETSNSSTSYSLKRVIGQKWGTSIT